MTPSLQGDSLFEPDDCVLTDVSLSDALTDRRLGLPGLQASNLQSDGDSYPNSPSNGEKTDNQTNQNKPKQNKQTKTNKSNKPEPFSL